MDLEYLEVRLQNILKSEHIFSARQTLEELIGKVSHLSDNVELFTSKVLHSAILKKCMEEVLEELEGSYDFEDLLKISKIDTVQFVKSKDGRRSLLVMRDDPHIFLDSVKCVLVGEFGKAKSQIKIRNPDLVRLISRLATVDKAANL